MKAMRKLFRDIHLWLSVPFGVIITLVCFSGAMLVFEKEVTQFLHPDVFTVDPQGRQPLPVDEVVRRASSTLPDGVEVTGVTVFADPAKAWQLPLSKPSKASVYVDPYTGEVTGRGDRLPFFRTMFSMHRWLLGSRPSGDGVFWGKMIVGVSTLLFVFVLISGIVIWWPRTRKVLKNSLKISVRNWRRFCYSLHVAGGVYGLLLLLLMALTGLTWSFGWYRTGFYGLFGVEMNQGGGHKSEKASADAKSGNGNAGKSHKGRVEKKESKLACWQDVYEQLLAENPSAAQISIADGTATIPANRFGNTKGSHRYKFDTGTGEVTARALYNEAGGSGKARGWVYALHAGTWGGWFSRILWFLSALLGATLPLTGYYLWLKRLCRKKG